MVTDWFEFVDLCLVKVFGVFFFPLIRIESTDCELSSSADDCSCIEAKLELFSRGRDDGLSQG